MNQQEVIGGLGDFFPQSSIYLLHKWVGDVLSNIGMDNTIWGSTKIE